MIRRFGLSMGGRIAGAALQVAVFALFARSLGVDLFGTFSLSISISLFALSVLDLGMGTRVLRGAATHDEDRALTSFAITRAACVVAIPFVAWVISANTGLSVPVTVAASAYAVGEATGDIAVGMKQGERRSGAAMLVLLSRRGVALGLLIALPTVAGATLAAAVTGAAGIVWFFVLAMARFTYPASLLTLLKENFGLMASGGASSFAQLDVTLVGITLGHAGAGLYGAAVRLFNPLNLAVSTLLQVVIPELSAASSHERRLQVFRRVRRLVVLSSCILVLSAFMAPSIVQLLYGDEYAAAGPVAAAVFVSAAISAVAQVHMTWFYAGRVPPAVPGGMWLGGGIGLAMVFLLSSLFGIVGAAYGLVLMHILVATAIVVPCVRAMREAGD